jgi:hypothetical protein
MTRRGTFRHEASTDKAYRFYPEGQPGLAFWIPRRVLTHRSKLNDDLHALSQITVEEWWVREHPELERYFA